MQDLLRQYETLARDVDKAVTQLDIQSDEQSAARLTDRSMQPDFWQDPQAAATLSQQLAALNKHVDSWRDLQHRLADEIAALKEFGTDAAYLESSARTYQSLEEDFAARQFELKLSGPHDKSSAIMEIHAGTGGTDAQDWAAMLQRMYVRWAEREGFSVDLLS